MNGADFDPFPLLAFSLGIIIVPLLAVTTTAFVKIAIVLFIVRNALGIQQTPPNMVLYAIALVLTIYVSAPLIAAIQSVVADPALDLSQPGAWAAAAEDIAEPVRAYLTRFATPEQRAFFVETTAALWPEDVHVDVTENDLVVLVPAFLVSELTRAFEIGFLLYLPFIVIDLIVTNILVAMGMMMVSPNLISLPFKLFLFVLVDGWTRLTHGLVLSYS